MTIQSNTFLIIIQFADLMQKCTSILKGILEKESKGWYIKFKDRMLADLKGEYHKTSNIGRGLF